MTKFDLKIGDDNLTFFIYIKSWNSKWANQEIFFTKGTVLIFFVIRNAYIANALIIPNLM